MMVMEDQGDNRVNSKRCLWPGGQGQTVHQEISGLFPSGMAPKGEKLRAEKVGQTPDTASFFS